MEAESDAYENNLLNGDIFMIVYPDKSTFGWDGDDGIGDRLIRQIIDGVKTATCSFMILYLKDELEAVFKTKGRIVTVVDAKDRPKCNIRILDVFETTFGNPDLRLVCGEGDGSDVAKFQEDHRLAWENTVFDTPLTDDAVLIVELFELVDVAD